MQGGAGCTESSFHPLCGWKSNDEMPIKSYSWLFYLAMIAAGAYLAADITNRLLWPKLEAILLTQPGTQHPGPSQSALPRVGNTSSDHSDDDLTLAGSLFHSEQPSIRPEDAGPLSASSPDPEGYVLLGTIIGQDQRSYAVIEQVKNREQGLYRPGDRLSDGVLMGAVHRNRVVIHRRDGPETLEVSFSAEAPPTVVPASVPDAAKPGEGVRQLSKNRYVLDRREVNDATDNLPTLLTKARIVPHFSEGKPDGFRVFAIHKDSLYAKIGLQNGDIVHRVNNIEIKDPQNFLQIFEQLKDEPNVVVDLVRNNKNETFSYEIR